MENLPATLLSETAIAAIIGAFVAIVGVAFSGFQQAKSLKTERDYAFKRVVFTEALESYHSLKQRLINMPQASAEDMQKQLDNNAWGAKISVVSNPATVEAVMNLSYELSRQILLSLPEKALLEDKRGDLNILSIQIDRISKNQDDLLQKMQEENLRDGRRTNLKFVQSMLDGNSKQLDKLFADQDSTQATFYRMLREFSLKIQKNCINLTGLELDVISKIRHELGLASDAKKLKKIMSEGVLKQNNLLVELDQVLMKVMTD